MKIDINLSRNWLKLTHGLIKIFILKKFPYHIWQRVDGCQNFVNLKMECRWKCPCILRAIYVHPTSKRTISIGNFNKSMDQFETMGHRGWNLEIKKTEKDTLKKRGHQRILLATTKRKVISSPPCDDLRLSFLRSMNVEAHKVRLIVYEWMETECNTYSRSYVVFEHLGTCSNFLLFYGGNIFFPLLFGGGFILKNGMYVRPQFVLSCQSHLLQHQMMHFDNTYIC